MKAVFTKALVCMTLALAGIPSEANVPTNVQRRIQQMATVPQQELPATMLSPQKAPDKIDVSWTMKVPQGAMLDNAYIYCLEDQKFRGATSNPASGSVSLDPGHYLFYFTAMEFFNMDRYFYVSKVIDITEEDTLEFDFADCINEVRLTPLLPNGEEAMPEVWIDFPSGNTYEQNIKSGNLYVALFREGLDATIAWQYMPLQKVDIGEETLLEGGNRFFVNNLDEDIEIGIMCDMTLLDSGEKVYTYNTLNGADITENTELTTAVSNYVYLNAEYGALADIPTKVSTPFSRFTTRIRRGDKIAEGAGGGVTGSTPYQSWVCVTKGNNTGTDFIYHYGQAPAGPDPDFGLFYCITSFPLTFSEGNARFNAYLADGVFHDDYLMQPEGGRKYFLEEYFYSQPAFSWDYNPEKIPVFANSVPVMVSAFCWQPGVKGGSFYVPQYYGRLGEYREPDIYESWAEVTHNGENVFQGNLEDLRGWLNDEFMIAKPEGIYTYTIDDDCATVDGMPSLNHTIITCDASNSDREAPTLTMLTFRNTDNELTDRFASKEECVLEFSAADFTSEINEYGLGWFQCASPASVKVECAPEGSDDFVELSVTEIPELYFSPGFGSFYRVSFAEADLHSATGWLKLRITVTDAVGNSQQQTLTPVVYIESLTSAEAIENGSHIVRDGDSVKAEGEICIYDLAGRIVRSGENVISTSDLTGAYVVRAAGKAMKVIL